MRCDFQEIEGEQVNERGKRRVRCSVCKRTTAPTASPLSAIHAQCNAHPKSPPGIGDHLHYWLTRWGITKELWLWLKHYGYPPEDASCGCDERQEQLNQAGWWISRTASRFVRWIRGRRTEV